MNKTITTFLVCLTTLILQAQNKISSYDSTFLKKYSRVYDVYENIAMVDFPEGGMGIIDIKTGKEIYKCNNCDVGSGNFFSNGLMEFVFPEPIFVDKNGKQYSATKKGPFKSDNGKFGFYNFAYSKEYKMYELLGKTPAKYDTVYQTVYDDLGNEVINKTGYFVNISNKTGLVDSLGNEVTPVKYDWIDYNYFGGEYTKVKLNGKTGLIDKLGKEVIAPAYYDVGKFSEGLAWVQPTQGGNFGYTDTKGKLIIDTILSYKTVGDFSEGLAVVTVDSIVVETGFEARVFGFIDKTGKEIISLKYTSAGNFKNGKAEVISIEPNKNGNYIKFYIDKNGNEVK